MTAALLIAFLAWIALCLSSLVVKVDAFVVVVGRVAEAIEHQNRHYGITGVVEAATPTATDDDEETKEYGQIR